MFGLPVGLVVALLVVVAAAVSIQALYLVRNSVTFEIRKGHNEVAGVVFAAVGVLYGVLLAFVVFAVWQRFTASEEAVSHEAALVVAAYRDTQEFPEKQRLSAETQLRAYVKNVMDTEWSSHGQVRRHGRQDALDPVWETYRQVERLTKEDRAQERLHDVEQARHERHLSQESSLPDIFWPILVLGAIYTLFFAFVFDMGNLRVQAVFTALLAGLLAVLLFLVLALQEPFTGRIQVSKNPFEHALLQFDAIDTKRLVDTTVTTPSLVTNAGDADSFPFIRVYGSGTQGMGATAFQLRNIKPGADLTLSITGLDPQDLDETDEYIEIDMKPGPKEDPTVKHSSGGDLIDKVTVDSTFWPLAPGANWIDIDKGSITGGTPSKFEVDWRDAWVGD